MVRRARVSLRLEQVIVRIIPLPRSPVTLQRASSGHATLFDSGTAYYEALIGDIAAAQISVDIEAYIFEYDAVGQRVIEALMAAAKRGVSVRVIVDGIGSYFAIDQLIARFSHGSAQLRIFHPSPWHLRAYRYALGHRGRGARFMDLLLRLNRRDHRKLAVIDRRYAWVGSFNISAVHLDDHLPRWRDFAVRLSDDPVSHLATSFDHLWHSRRNRHHSGFMWQYFTTLSPVNRFIKNRTLIRLINRANTRVWICTAYFSPSGRLLRVLKRAARRNVDVRLTVPAKSDIIFFPALTATFYSDLLRHGVRVFEFQRGILHAKAMLVDDTGLLGSSNLNYRSLLHDLELDVLLSSAGTVATLEGFMRDDMAHSDEVTSGRTPRILFSALMGWLPRLLRYWL